jgi:hypothetical protein
MYDGGRVESKRNKCANALIRSGVCCTLPTAVLITLILCRIDAISNFKPWDGTWDYLHQINVRAIGCSTWSAAGAGNQSTLLACMDVDRSSLDVRNGTLCFADGVECGDTWHVSVIQDRPTDRFPSSATWPMSCELKRDKGVFYVCTYPDVVGTAASSLQNHIEYDSTGKVFRVSYTQAPRLCDHIVMQVITHSCTELSFVMVVALLASDDNLQQTRVETRVCQTSDQVCLDAPPPNPIQWFAPRDNPSELARESGQTGTNGAKYNPYIYACVTIVMTVICFVCIGCGIYQEQPSRPVAHAPPPQEPEHQVEGQVNKHQVEGQVNKHQVDPNNIALSAIEPVSQELLLEPGSNSSSSSSSHIEGERDALV